jgi:hypothetical protein
MVDVAEPAQAHPAARFGRQAADVAEPDVPNPDADQIVMGIPTPHGQRLPERPGRLCRHVAWMNLIRQTLITPKAIGEMIDIINEHVRLQSENQAPELERARHQIAGLEKQDASLRRALRTARPNAAVRIALEIDQVAAEIRQAVAKRDELEQVRRPMSTSKKFVQQTMDGMTGLIKNAALDTPGSLGCATCSTGHGERPRGARRGHLEDGDRRRC